MYLLNFVMHIDGRTGQIRFDNKNVYCLPTLIAFKTVYRGFFYIYTRRYTSTCAKTQIQFN